MSMIEELRKIATAVGSPIEGKSAEQLSAHITQAATKTSPAEIPNIIDPNALIEHFEEGRFTDCSIRVKIRGVPATQPADRPAKRLRSGRSKATESEGPADEAEGVHVIKAHAVILTSRSPYFARAMGGEWRQSQDRSFEVEVGDEEEYMTFRRLIKLCYGTTFIKEGDQDLDFFELVRLIHVANAFECMDAVKQCTMALQRGNLGWEGALQCLELTDMLKDVEGMADLAKKTADAIIKEVGPVHELFVPSKEKGEPNVLGGLKLSDKVKDLSPAAFEALISLKGLQLQTANEAFWLVLAWVEAQSEESEEGKQVLFNRMAKHLRFHVMDPGYILLIVSEHPRIIAAGLQYNAIRASLIHSNLARRASADIKLFDRTQTLALDHMCPERKRGKPKWTFDMKLTAAEVAAIKPGKKCRKIVGLAAGLPWSVSLTSVKPKKGTESEGQRLAVHIMCSLPFEWMSFEGGAGFYFNYKIEVGVGTPREKSLASRTWSELSGRGGTFAALEEVFREGSEWLVNGELHVKLTVTTTKDRALWDPYKPHQSNTLYL